ncbi:MAG: hypothetical protein K1X83_05355 [Oligoflexia bacterium]|nr:hypothetical protein [Oligoflexia bacterium]
MKISNSFTTSTSTCPAKYQEVYRPAASALLSDISGVDGSGSGLDADTLDGHSSADFSSASDLSTVTTRVSDLETETRDDHVIRVSVSGGDYSSLATAIAAISDAAEDNPYLVIVGPGSFAVDSALTIPSGVHVRGAGMYATTLEGSISAGSVASGCLLNLSSGASLSYLGIRNAATTNHATAICASNISASDTADPSTFTTFLDHVYLDVTGATGTGHYGLYATNADVLLRHSAVRVGNATIDYGAYFSGSGSTKVARVEGTSFRIIGGNGNAILTSGSTLTTYISGATIDTDGVGIYASNSRIQFTHSTLNGGGSYALYANGASATIIVNQIQIDAALHAGTASGGTVTCSFVSELSSGVGHASTCS